MVMVGALRLPTLRGHWRGFMGMVGALRLPTLQMSLRRLYVGRVSNAHPPPHKPATSQTRRAKVTSRQNQIACRMA